MSLRSLPRFSKKVEEAPDQALKAISPAVAVLALMADSCKDRALVLRCLHLAKELVHQKNLVKRLDVEQVRYVMQMYADDVPIQIGCCECLTTFLQATRTRYSAVSSRALVEQPSTGNIEVVKDVISSLGLQRGATAADALITEASCNCLAEIARCGGNVVADIRRFHGPAQIWHMLKSLDADGRKLTRLP